MDQRNKTRLQVQVRKGHESLKFKSPDIIQIEAGQQLDPRQIADSGQCFRMKRLDSGRYCNVAFGKYMELEKTAEGEVLFYCSREDFEAVWYNYYDLQTDYASYIRQVAGDPFLKEAAKVGGGIRILRQELWEIMVTFIISANNNIPRIKNAVETLCRCYGNPEKARIGSENAAPVLYHTFPTPEALAKCTIEELRDCGLGYRDRYVKSLAEETVKTNNKNLNGLLKVTDHKTAVSELMKTMGIGAKVANCIALFGLHIMDAYPVDTWIKAVIEDVYDGDFDASPYKGYEGYIQQLQFYYYRMLKGRS